MENEEMKINCDRAEELMGEYIDGELSPEKKAALDEHLSSCAECKSDFEKLKKTVELLGSAEEEVPTKLYTSVMAKLEPKKKSRTVLIRRIGTVCAAAFIFVLAGTYVMPKLAGGADNMSAPEEDKFYDAAYYVGASNEKSDSSTTEMANTELSQILICSFSKEAEMNSFESDGGSVKIADIQAGAIALVYESDEVCAYDLRNAKRIYLTDIFSDLSYLNDYVKQTYGADEALTGEETFEFGARGIVLGGEYTIPWNKVSDETVEKYMLDDVPMIVDHITNGAKYETVVIRR